MRAIAIWCGLVAALVLPVIAAGFSPYLAWRDPVYIIAGFAGIFGLCLLVLQPVLAAGQLPGIRQIRGRKLHRWGGAALILCILLHITGLWITSPPDMVDALLLDSPTPFSLWGVISMWSIFAAGAAVLLRRKLRPRIWRLIHTGLAAIIVGSTVLHAILIEGAMELYSKMVLCAVAVIVAANVILRIWIKTGRR